MPAALSSVVSRHASSATLADADLLALVQRVAIPMGLPVPVVLALIRVESGGNPFAWNPEPEYSYLWNVKTQAPFRRLTYAELLTKTPPRDFPTLRGDPDNEYWGQSASWGLMQVMGAVARELGFIGPYLTELCDPETNVVFGCLKLKKEWTWAKGDPERALASYNGGRMGNVARPFRNQDYAAKVLGAVTSN